MDLNPNMQFLPALCGKTPLEREDFLIAICLKGKSNEYDFILWLTQKPPLLYRY